MINRDKIKRELERLIEEAPRIAPSIVRFEVDRRYGRVTDEDLDEVSLVRWDVEVAAILSLTYCVYASTYFGQSRNSRGQNTVYIMHSICEKFLDVGKISATMASRRAANCREG